MFTNMFEYYNMLRSRNVYLVYSGPLWADSIEDMGRTVRKRLKFDELPLAASQSVFSVFIEQMNNMLMYSEEKEKFFNSESGQLETTKGMFVLGIKDNKYFMQTGNFMKTEKVDGIKKQIDYLNTLEKSEIRKFYKQQIKSDNTNSESKGAGLGFIEIARRASSKIEYSFVSQEDNLTFFSLFVTIG